MAPSTAPSHAPRMAPKTVPSTAAYTGAQHDAPRSPAAEAASRRAAVPNLGEASSNPNLGEASANPNLGGASRRAAAPEPRCAHDGASSAATEGEVTNALRRALMESEATNALVRRCYATDKLGLALDASAAGALRRAWHCWWVCACALEGEMASDEADRLRAALTSELELNAKLQERLTNLELAPSSADEPRTKDGRLNLGRAPSRAPGAPTEPAPAVPDTALAPETARGGGLVFKSESEWQSREREIREMRRQLAVARAHIEQLEKDLSAAQRRADQLVATSQRERSRASSHVASRASTPCPSDDGSHPYLGGSSSNQTMAALQEEVTAPRFARWRVLVSAMKRKRSEQRLAVALAARRPAIATVDEEAVRQLLQAKATGLEPNLDTSPRMRVLTTAPYDLAWHASAHHGARPLPLVPPSGKAGRRALPSDPTARDAHHGAARGAAAMRMELVELRTQRQRESETQGMLQEAIQAGDAQTRRVLQLQKAVGATRRTLAACLLRASLAAAGRGRCAHALHRWAVAVHAHERIRTVLDVRTANKAAEVARSTARTAEGIAKDAQSAASKLQTVEKQRSALRAEVNALTAELEAEKRRAVSVQEEHAHKLGLLERTAAAHEKRARQLDVVVRKRVGERAELEAQLRALHRKMRQSSLLLAPPTSPGAHHGASTVPSPGGSLPGAHHGASTVPGAHHGASPGGSLPGAHHGATPTDASAVVSAAAADGVGARRALNLGQNLGPNLGPNLGGARVVASTASSPPRTYVPASPPRTAAQDGATGARDDAPSPRTALAAERTDKEQALALRTRAVRDLKACRDALAQANGRLDETQRLLAQANGRLDETQRLLALAKLLLHARSRVGRPAALLRMLAAPLRMLGALRDWAAATRVAPCPSWLFSWLSSGGDRAPSAPAIAAVEETHGASPKGSTLPCTMQNATLEAAPPLMGGKARFLRLVRGRLAATSCSYILQQRHVELPHLHFQQQTLSIASRVEQA
ncbi:hypothetical protein Ctob_000872 [Chrysochromulina tobinii]|uniref:Uncharacterized protein n=1 Tax=Chrysochromulina tobinii TaxID=1460289 RepID=A0A0M0JK90_9EUKA|nr:hypothetical protein Ctob_000872 [Chrysochromulina tobinii]|eukprot:KOO26991.1 hypothetical protein Ctob_000872 [Chrysochromulina sp. CCMP291]